MDAKDKVLAGEREREGFSPSQQEKCTSVHVEHGMQCM